MKAYVCKASFEEKPSEWLRGKALKKMMQGWLQIQAVEQGQCELPKGLEIW